MICVELGRERSAIMQMRVISRQWNQVDMYGSTAEMSFFVHDHRQDGVQRGFEIMVRKQIEGNRERYAVSTSVPSLETN